ncbi:MAG: hypothetical protein FWC07_05625 [Defluviitaleaceae bacterium]|nr:hypothetical protein [Defluviitaleaceae bacterium]
MHSKRLLLVAGILFLLTLVPIVWLGLYARPAKDDYIFSASSSFLPTAQYWVEDAAVRHRYFERSVRYARVNGGVLDVPRAVVRTVVDNYRDWQGTFTAIALFSVHPGVFFGHGAYPLTMLFTLLPLILSLGFLTKTVLRTHWLMPCMLVLTACIQFVPHIGQGFYWYNGGVFYVFFFALMWTSLALKMGRPTRWPAVAGIAVLDFLIGGGNLVTALFAAQVNVLFALYTLWKSRKTLWPTLVYAGAAVLGLLINVAAPGNTVRSGGLGGLRHAFWSVRAAMLTAGEDLVAWTTPAVVILLILAVPWLWRAAKASAYTFKAPLIVAGLSFLLFASLSAPPFFGQMISGPPRLRNIVYFSYVLLVFGNVFYLLGWIARNYELQRIVGRGRALLPRKMAFACVGVILLGAAIYLGYENASTWRTAQDLRSGAAGQFRAEHRARMALLEGGGGRVYLPAYSAPPMALVSWWDGIEPFLWTELGIGHSFLVNRGIANYFGWDYVVGLPPPRTRAVPGVTYFSFGGREGRLEAFTINDNRYLRLRDFGWLLEDVFDVAWDGTQYEIMLGHRYTPVGGEGRVSGISTPRAAYFAGQRVRVDGADKVAMRYYVYGEPFFRMVDLLELTGLGFVVRQGVFYLER